MIFLFAFGAFSEILLYLAAGTYLGQLGAAQVPGRGSSIISTVLAFGPLDAVPS